VKRRLIIVGLSLLLVFVAALVVARRQPPEPVFAGKTLTVWIMQFYSPAPDAQIAATNAIREMGGGAVPALIRLLNARDAGFSERLWNRLPNLPRLLRRPVARALPAPKAVAVRGAAARALGVLEQQGSPGIPGLQTMMLHDTVENQWEAAGALGAIGPAAIPALLSGLRATNSITQQAAAANISKLREAAAIAIPDLVRLLSDESETTRAFAASTLSSIGTPALPSLQQNIETGQGIGRRLAAETLVAIRPSRRTAAPLLRKLLSDEDPASRAKAMELMATVHVNDSESFITISNRLHDTNPGVRQMATNILLKLRNEGTYPTATSNP
jgi:hypothetical protein